MIVGITPDLPRTDDEPSPGTWLFRLARVAVAAALRARWTVRVHDPGRVPAQGPAILVANHLGVLDGPLLAAVTPRTSFALVKREMYGGFMGRVLTLLGQIPVDRHTVDTAAIRRSVRVLRDGHVLVVFPEGVRGAGDMRVARGGAVYLAMVTGAAIVPVALLGTRQPGQTTDDLPDGGAEVHVVYGEPFALPRLPWPRRKAVVTEHTEQLRRRLAEHVALAQLRTGLTLPGPPTPKAARRPAPPTSGSPSAHDRV